MTTRLEIIKWEGTGRLVARRRKRRRFGRWNHDQSPFTIAHSMTWLNMDVRVHVFECVWLCVCVVESQSTTNLTIVVFLHYDRFAGSHASVCTNDLSLNLVV